MEICVLFVYICIEQFIVTQAISMYKPWAFNKTQLKMVEEKFNLYY